MAAAKVENPAGLVPAPDPLKAPADFAKMLAMDIGGALMPTSASDGSQIRGGHGAAAPAATFELAVRMDDPTGMTWAEIVGEDMS